MSERPHEYRSELPHEEERLAAQRASLLAAVDFTKRWHQDTLDDPNASPLEKRRSRDRRREIIERLVTFDEQYPDIAPPEEE